ncbi:MAG TPA: hypothetical protein VF240_08555 [Pyrinomonadaceae bacterium]
MRLKLALALAFLCCAQSAAAQARPRVREADRVRLAEAFRLGETLGDRIWTGWSKAPFAVLLVTPEGEFLVRHPKPPQDFAPVGHDPLLRGEVFFREPKLNPALLATFPVGGVPTIVIGQAENTASKTSTPWVLTVLHEHFHQLQYSQPNYYDAVGGLNLSRGDQTGMWMLNFAFPYREAEVQSRFESLSKLLAEALQARGKKDFSTRLARYLEARRVFASALAPDDYRYFSFQVWQEGVSRYTEYRIAELAAKSYKPSKGFRELKDYTPFAEVADRSHQGVLSELTTLRLESYGRVAFYPLGAGEGLLLDRVNRRWRDRYFADKFYLEKYFGAR